MADLNLRQILHTIVNRPSVKKFLTNNRVFSRAYFEMLFFKKDVWHGTNPNYELYRDKAFEIISGKTFKQGLEIGCGEGHTTNRIAERCEKVIACDISSIALKRAKDLHNFSNVTFSQLDMAKDNITGKFDYIYCGEVLYYLHISQLPEVVNKITDALFENGVIHLLHHRSKKDDSAGLELKEFGAKTIHDEFIAHKNLHTVKDVVDGIIRITLLEKRTNQETNQETNL